MFTIYHSSTVRLVILHLVAAFPLRQGLFGIASASVFRNLQDTEGMTSAEMWVALKTYPYTPWCWYIYLQNWVILFGQILVNIPAPWSIWDIYDNPQFHPIPMANGWLTSASVNHDS